jgi:hypothetical protein
MIREVIGRQLRHFSRESPKVFEQLDNQLRTNVNQLRKRGRRRHQNAPEVDMILGTSGLSKGRQPSTEKEAQHEQSTGDKEYSFQNHRNCGGEIGRHREYVH